MKDQEHPRSRQDRDVVNRLLRDGPTEANLIDLARLRIRYNGFPGARAIQRDLDLLLQQWQLDEDSLFARTRALYVSRNLQGHSSLTDEQDWS
ncbi:protein of unknown function (DUF3288) [Rubidibacter lacunae KORDI 51-2]|uniref:DUF3288 domain-containing protein n=1 Tax=Rubidibacter lacunae KORDI 51-2 TaxID=582515 RepID=U5DQ13_9CHRO|nr:DUF3288 family protein [Rubidibacter lacunae]ERN42694.1 protein of unknown function (DUF3288) [Rubidibacter lacunae KORDI 51-2]